MCDNHGIATNSTNDNVPSLLSLITAHLKDLPDDGRNEDVFKMLRSSAAILHGINNLRNNYSMAHPTETLLNEADARFAINLAPDVPAALPLPDPGIPSPFSSFLPLAPAVCRETP